MLTSLTPPFFSALEGSRRILIAGMGGGFIESRMLHRDVPV